MGSDKPTLLERILVPDLQDRIQKQVDSKLHESHLAIMARGVAEGTGRYTVIGGYSYDGEKNLGEIGPIKGYHINYEILRQRSWDSYLDSEIAQTVINKYVSWVIGKGLKLQAEPQMTVLKQEGYTFEKEDWSKLVESRWGLYAESRESDYTGMRCLNDLEAECFKNALIGGDVLVIIRYIKNVVKVQLIDGAHVVSPRHGTEYSPDVLANGNKIVHGIEISPKGEHVAYHVRKPGLIFETERVEAKGKGSKSLYAFMVYGNKYRIDSVRGMPLLSVVMETVKKLERYKEATVGSAEERQKIAYTVEHQAFSTGENPLAGQTMKAFDVSRMTGGDMPIDDLGEQVADKIAATTQKQTFNLPVGAKLNEVTSKNELYFKDFYGVNIDILCAACEIPPNVAMSKYDSNFSASRAALKDWDNTLNTKRHIFSRQFLKPIYTMFMDTEIMKNKIQAKGYIEAIVNDDYMLLEAYRKYRFIGTPVPHIDPVKEVTAERLKLGKAADAMPLTTLEQATEILNGGDAEDNIEQFASELKKSEKLGIKLPELNMPQNGQNGQPKPGKNGKPTESYLESLS